MWSDPIVEEIRQIRENYAAQFDYDIDAIVKDIQRQQRESGREYVTLTPHHSIRVAENTESKRIAPSTVNVVQP